MIDAGKLWDFTSGVWLVATAATVAYLFCARPLSIRHGIAWTVAMALLVLAYISPVGVLADGYLFSAHMIQHLLLLMIIPLCMLLSIPAEAANRWLAGNSRLGRWGQRLATPWLGWFAGVGAMWFWHEPALCDASTKNHLIGLVRDTSFLVAGGLFWWQVFAPKASYRLSPLPGIVYLFSACLGCTLLGIYITFTSVAVCPAFSAPRSTAIVQYLFDMGLTPQNDQHLGGLLMWVPPCTLYVSAAIALLTRWYAQIEKASLPRTAPIMKGQL